MTALVLIGIAAFYVMMGTDIIPRRIERARSWLRRGMGAGQ
jgi:hypothetical protein